MSSSQVGSSSNHARFLSPQPANAKNKTTNDLEEEDSASHTSFKMVKGEFSKNQGASSSN